MDNDFTMIRQGLSASHISVSVISGSKPTLLKKPCFFIGRIVCLIAQCLHHGILAPFSRKKCSVRSYSALPIPMRWHSGRTPQT